MGKIAMLLDQVQNINDIDFNDNGKTPLHLAAEKDYLKIIEALIAKNADIDIKNKDGDTASDLAHLKVKDYI